MLISFARPSTLMANVFRKFVSTKKRKLKTANRHLNAFDVDYSMNFAVILSLNFLIHAAVKLNRITFKFNFNAYCTRDI